MDKYVTWEELYIAIAEAVSLAAKCREPSQLHVGDLDCLEASVGQYLGKSKNLTPTIRSEAKRAYELVVKRILLPNAHLHESLPRRRAVNEVADILKWIEEHAD